MTKIIISGCCGHMGKVLASIIAERKDATVVGGVDIAAVCNEMSGFPVYNDIDKVDAEADVIIDFSSTKALEGILDYAIKKNIACVLCTTGYSDEQVSSIKQAANQIPIFYSRNMSIGINLLIELSKKAAKILGNEFDVEIIEKHHNQKVDAPSGTALMIADALSSVRSIPTEYVYDRHLKRQKRKPQEIGIHSIRGGTIVGEHEVIFAGRQELLTISHSAQSKELFAVGAVNAAVYMNDKKAGLYDMSNMIDME
jgi:4-hydroxy-tetrahydrodipicolinate reductase